MVWQVQDYVIDRVVGSERDDAGKLLYRTSRYGYDPDWYTLEQLEYLPRFAVLRYHRLTGTAPPQTFGNAPIG